MEAQTMIIALNELEFFGYHGLYEGEKQLGNRFIVNAKLECTVIPDGDINHTVDYGTAYSIIASEMAEPKQLLEQLVFEIAVQLLGIKRVDEVYVSIAKENPPIGGICQSSEVSIQIP